MRTTYELVKYYYDNECVTLADFIEEIQKESYNEAIDDAYHMLDRFDQDHELGDIFTLKK